MMPANNPYKDELTRLRLEKMKAATDAKNKVASDFAATTRSQKMQRNRDDIEVVKAVVALTSYASTVGSGLASIGLFPTKPSYKESRWLIDISMATAGAPEHIRREVKGSGTGSTANGSPGRLINAGAAAMDLSDSCAGIAKFAANPMVVDAAKLARGLYNVAFGSPLLASYTEKLLNAYPTIGLGATIGRHASQIITQTLTWLSSHTQIIATASYVTQVLAHAGTALRALTLNGRLAKMECIRQDYELHCRCCNAAAKISSGWLAGLGGKVVDLVPGVGVAHVGATYGMKIVHRFKKWGGSAPHRPPFFIATDLWRAARRDGDPGYVFCGKRSSTAAFPLQTDGRCPVALLIIATLFGSGKPADGIRKAASTLIADEHDAVNKIKHRIGNDFGSAFESGMEKMDSWLSPAPR
jgi:hypothetical protein